MSFLAFACATAPGGWVLNTDDSYLGFLCPKAGRFQCSRSCSVCLHNPAHVKLMLACHSMTGSVRRPSRYLVPGDYVHRDGGR